MTFPAAYTNAVDGVTEVLAEHLNNLEGKVGIDGSSSESSLDYKVCNTNSLDPGHKHRMADGAIDLPLTIDSHDNVGFNQEFFGSSAQKVIAVGNGTPPVSSPPNAFQMYAGDRLGGDSCPHFFLEDGALVILFQGAALTVPLTTITHTAPTPDYAIQDLTDSGYGFATKDEGNTVLAVIANLQARVNELEARLEAHGLLAPAA